MIVILDNIRSIYNVGSVFRTSDAVGVEKIYIVGITPAPLDRFGLKNESLAKVALGAEQTVPWSRVLVTSELLDNLKQKGYTIFVLEQTEKSINIFSATFKNLQYTKMVLVIGAEVEGVSEIFLNKADHVIEIPMHGCKESLNVSVAFGIAVYQLTNIHSLKFS